MISAGDDCSCSRERLVPMDFSNLFALVSEGGGCFDAFCCFLRDEEAVVAPDL